MTIDQRLIRRIKLRELHALVVAAQSGSLLKASNALAMSQPAVSKAIAELEGVLNVRLLNRTNRGVEPTAEGRSVLARATAIFDEIRRATQDLAFLADPTVGKIRLGCVPAEAAGLLPHLIERFNRVRPGIGFSVVEEGSEELRRAVRECEVELALCRTALAVPEDDLVFEPIHQDPVAVVAASSHALANRRSIKPSDLASHPWVLTPLLINNRQTADAFAAWGMAMPEAVVQTASIGTTFALLSSGRFMTLLPRSILDLSPAARGFRALTIDLPMAPPTVGWLSVKGRQLTPVARIFAAFVRDDLRRNAGPRSVTPNRPVRPAGLRFAAPSASR